MGDYRRAQDCSIGYGLGFGCEAAIACSCRIVLEARTPNNCCISCHADLDSCSYSTTGQCKTDCQGHDESYHRYC